MEQHSEQKGIYRGKRIDTGEWIIGNLVTTNKGFAGIATFTGKFLDGKIRAIIDEVDTHTICLSTGLRDQNGTLIFTDDVLIDSYDGLKRAVYWDDTEGGFMTTEADGFPNLSSMEICGNLIDSPKLLRENNNG